MGRLMESTENSNPLLIGDPAMTQDSPDSQLLPSQVLSEGTEDFLLDMLNLRNPSKDSGRWSLSTMSLFSNLELSAPVQKEGEVLQVASGAEENLKSEKKDGDDGSLTRKNGSDLAPMDLPSEVSKQPEPALKEAEPLSTVELFKGDYDFRLVVPQQGNGKTVLFSDCFSKLYCTPFSDVELRFVWNFDASKGDDLKLKAYLRLVMEDLGGALVLRNLEDVRTQKIRGGNLKRKSGISSMKDRSIIQCKDSDCIYVQEPELKGRAVVLPVQRTQFSTGFISMAVQFTCLTSDFPRCGKKAPQIILIFELHEGGNVMGRVGVNLRVSTLPRRDFLIDVEKISRDPMPRRSKRKQVKAEAVESAGKKMKQTVAERIELSTNAAISTVTTANPCAEGTSTDTTLISGEATDFELRFQHTLTPAFVALPTKTDKEQCVNDSQESECLDIQLFESTEVSEEKLKELNSLLEQAQWILTQQNDANSMVRFIARNFGREIRKTHRIIAAARQYQAIP